MFQRQSPGTSKAGASSRLRLMDGQVFADKYYALEKIGHGQKSVVYRARPKESVHTVALKLLLPNFAIDTELAKEWQKESAPGGKLDHPGIVKILDFGFDDPAKLSYIVMEFVEGVPLYELMQRTGKLDRDTSLSLIKQIANVLDTAHRAGFVHGDLNLANIIIAKDEHGNYEASIVDFGIIQVTTPVPKSGKESKDRLGSATLSNLPRAGRDTTTGITALSPNSATPLQRDIDAVSMIMCHLLLDSSTKSPPHFETMQALIEATADTNTLLDKFPARIANKLPQSKPSTALVIAAMLVLFALIILFVFIRH